MAKIPTKPSKPLAPLPLKGGGKVWGWATRFIYALCIILPFGLAITLFMNKGASQHSVGWDAVQFTSAPPMPVAVFLNEIRSLAGLGDTLDLHDPMLLGKLQTACSHHPWVAKVLNVSLVAPQKIQLDLVFRQPAARLRHNDRWYLVDQEGYLLEPLLRDSEKELLELLGWDALWPFDEKAKNWLIAGAVLAEFLQKDHGRWSIDAIFLLRQPVLGAELRLQTKQGQQIVWQTLDAGFHEEPTAEEKLSRLRKYFEQYGEIPRGQMLDMRSKEGVLRRKQSP